METICIRNALLCVREVVMGIYDCADTHAVVMGIYDCADALQTARARKKTLPCRYADRRATCRKESNTHERSQKIGG